MTLIEDELFEEEREDSNRHTEGLLELPDKDLPWQAKKKYTSPTTPRFVGFETVYVPCKHAGWVNCYIAYKVYRTREESFSSFRLSLRKYQKVNSKWNRRQSYNINTLDEAREILRMIKAYFPELLAE